MPYWLMLVLAIVPTLLVILYFLSKLGILLEPKRGAPSHQWEVAIPSSEETVEVRRHGAGCDRCIFWNRVHIREGHVFFHVCTLERHNTNPDLLCISTLEHGCDKWVQRSAFWDKWTKRV